MSVSLIQPSFSRGEVGPGVAQEPGAHGAKRIEALPEGSDHIDRCQHAADVETGQQAKEQRQRIPPGGVEV